MDNSTQKIIAENQRTWDQVADFFLNASALPIWGPFGVGDDLDLIPEIKGKAFLEIGCGSGRSIKYLTDRGAKKVYGLDLSAKQIAEATQYNSKAISQGKAQLIQSAMENKISTEPVDCVFSIYALGWTPEPKQTLGNIYDYLKPGGLFVWSWDHSFFTDVQYEDGKFVVAHSYHEERLIEIKNWKKEGATARLIYRKTSSWFQLLRDAGFQIVAYHEPKPKSLFRGHKDPTQYYSIEKAEKVPCSFIFVCKKV